MRRLLSGVTALAVAATVMLVTAPAQAATRYVVTASASTAKVDVGQSFTLRGKVTPKAKGQRVKVQRLVGSTWTTISKPVLNRYSRYSTTVKVTAPGDNRYRVVKPRTDGHPKGVSPTVTVVAWRWRPVASLPLTTDSLRTVHEASGPLNGNTYAPFIRQSAPYGDGFYRLDGKCTQFEAVVGMTSDSLMTLDTATATVYGSPMSAPTVFETLSWNPDKLNKFDEPLFIRRGPADMSNVAVLWLQTTGLDANDYGGWGNPRVYCRS
jgi:hypothetical protein